MIKLIISILLMTATLTAIAAPIADYGFKSPSFNGQGYSSHVLTIENQEATRKKALADAKLQAAKDAASAAQNTNLVKFLNNLESRIYAQISQNLATAMFASGGSNSGVLNFEGNTIAWSKDSANVYMTVTDLAGNITNVTVPLGQFQF